MSLGIFCWNPSSGSKYINKGARIYELTFKENGTVSADFIPCYRKSDNEIGMYDTVSKQFFTNQCTGTFLKGADVDRIHGSIDWTNDVGTVYGGYVDLVSGELVEEWHSFLINSNTEVGIFPWGGIKTDSATGIEYATALFRRYGQDPKAYNIKENICDKLPYSTNQSKINTAYMYDGDTYGGAISLPTSEIGTTAESLSQYLADKSFTIVYKLREPIHYQLTPQQLTALRGTNNIYSNTDGQTEIKYWTH